MSTMCGVLNRVREKRKDSDSGWVQVGPDIRDEQIEQEDIDRLLLFEAVWAEWDDASGDASTDA